MKTLLICILLLAGLTASAQQKPSAAIVKITSYGMEDENKIIMLLLQHELEKSSVYTMMDPEEVEMILQSSGLNTDSCFGLNCALKAGNILKIEKAITARYEVFGKKIIITLKQYDINASGEEKSVSGEYIYVEEGLGELTAAAVANLTGRKKTETAESLSYYDQPLIHPNARNNLSGPRFGAYITTGDAGRFMKAPKEAGGFEMEEISTTFGWQAEKQYLSAGKFSALIEAIILVSGLESGRFIPSVSFMNGFRSSKGNWELAMGPSVRIINMRDGQINSKGSPGLSTGFVFAGGKTFRSGYLNLPVNVYVIPRKAGWVCGLSMGFNIYKEKEIKARIEQDR